MTASLRFKLAMHPARQQLLATNRAGRALRASKLGAVSDQVDREAKARRLKLEHTSRVWHEGGDDAALRDRSPISTGVEGFRRATEGRLVRLPL